MPPLRCRSWSERSRASAFFATKPATSRPAASGWSTTSTARFPTDLESLVELPGIGRKTANVVLGTAFGIASGVVVDTHVSRITHRLGLTKQTDAVKIERDLMELLPRRQWIDFSHRLIHHGRQVCIARSPKCGECTLADLCPQIGVGTKAESGRQGQMNNRF